MSAHFWCSCRRHSDSGYGISRHIERIRRGRNEGDLQVSIISNSHKRNVRMDGKKGIHQWRDETVDHIAARTKSDQTGTDRREDRRKRLISLDNPLGILTEDMSVRGQDHISGKSVEQTSAYNLLQLCNILAYSRLGYMQCLRSFGKAA